MKHPQIQDAKPLTSGEREYWLTVEWGSRLFAEVLGQFEATIVDLETQIGDLRAEKETR